MFDVVEFRLSEFIEDKLPVGRGRTEFSSSFLLFEMASKYSATEVELKRTDVQTSSDASNKRSCCDASNVTKPRSTEERTNEEASP